VGLAAAAGAGAGVALWLVIVTLTEGLHAANIWDRDTQAELAGIVVAGAALGWLLGQIWRGVRPALDKRTPLMLAAGWAASLAVGGLIGATLVETLGVFAGAALGGGMVGVLGGAVTLWYADRWLGATPAGGNTPDVGDARGAAEATAPGPTLAGLLRTPLVTAVLIAVTWMAARWLAELLFSEFKASGTLAWLVNWTLGGALGGAVMGLVLGALEPAWNRQQAAWRLAGLFAGAWLLSFLMANSIWALSHNLELSLPDSLPTHVALPIGMGVAGYALGAALWGVGRGVPGGAGHGLVCGAGPRQRARRAGSGQAAARRKPVESSGGGQVWGGRRGSIGLGPGAAGRPRLARADDYGPRGR
jgi:hypothetical protein